MAELLVWLLYRLRVSGRENVPAEGGAVLISNHMTYLDVVFITLAARRKIRFIAPDILHKANPLRWLMRLSSIELIAPEETRSSLENNLQFLKRGGLLGIFPEGQVSRTGNLMKLRSGFEIMARQSGVPGGAPVHGQSLANPLFAIQNQKHALEALGFSKGDSGGHR